MPKEYESTHHLWPRAIKCKKGKKPKDTIIVHRYCHDKLHSVFTNKELAKTYNTVEKIVSHPEMSSFECLF